MCEVVILFDNDVHPQTSIFTQNHELVAEFRKEIAELVLVNPSKIVLHFNGQRMEDSQEIDSFYFQNFMPAIVNVTILA